MLENAGKTLRFSAELVSSMPVDRYRRLDAMFFTIIFTFNVTLTPVFLLVLSLAHCKYISGRQINLLFYLPMINPNSILQSISFDLLKSLIVQVHPHLLLGGWHNGHLWASSSQLWNEVTKRKLPLEDNFFFRGGRFLERRRLEIPNSKSLSYNIFKTHHHHGSSPNSKHHWCFISCGWSQSWVLPPCSCSSWSWTQRLWQVVFLLRWSPPTTQSPYNTCLQGFQSNRSRPSCTEVMPWKLLHIPKKCHSPSPVPSTWGNSKNCSGIWRRQASTCPQFVKSP